MKIETINNPANPSVHGAKAEPQMSARERAIAALMGGQAQQPVVQNSNQVSPEELSAVQPPSAQVSEDAGQKDTVEAPAEAPKAASEEPLSSQYAVLARKEKQIRQREQALRAREEAIKASSEAPKAPSAPAFDPNKYVDRERLVKDPFTVLNEMGLSYDQLTELAMNGPSQESLTLQTELKALREELKTLKGEQEQTSKSFKDQQEAQVKQAVAQIRVEAKTLVNNNPNFETIKETDSVEDVVELIKRTFDEDGVLMTVEEAAQQVEDYLVEEAMKIAKIKKIQQRLQPAAPAANPEAQKSTGQQKQPLSTLTNSVSSSRQLSARERAVLAFEGKLGK